MISLLRTKLYSPPVHPDLVSRQRLLDRLNTDLWSVQDTPHKSFARKLTLVSAPAGFGKTTLIAEWITKLKFSVDNPEGASQHLYSGWLSLDEIDNDSERFLTYLVAALQNAGPEIGQQVQVQLQSGTIPYIDDAMLLLLNDIAMFANSLMLVLDDYHVIHTEFIDQLLIALLDHQPLNFHLVIISRADPPLQLSRLRVRRQMLEIRAHDLRFTEEEVIAFLSSAVDLDLPSDAIAALERRTEGWIAGLQLAALSLQGREDVEEYIRTFSGDNRYIIDYLVEEVLSLQPPEVHQFLVHTSILEWLCAPLCDAVLAYGDERSQDILEYLERNNLFLISLDDHRKWYRYHHLFADSLRTDLDSSQQVLSHQRAARWYMENGFLPRAIYHALAAPDYELAAELLGEAGREAALWAGGEFKRYCEWVEMLPVAVQKAHPRLQVVYSRALEITGQVAKAEQVLASVEQALQVAPVKNSELLATTAMYQAQCLLERGNLDRGLELANYAVTHLSESTPLNYTRALHSLACIEYGLGHFNSATPRFTLVSQISESQSLALNAAECAARGLLLQGKLRAAQAMAEQLISSARTRTTYNHLAAGAFATLSEINYYQNNVESVISNGEQAIELAQRMAPRALLRAHEIWVYLQYARLQQAQGHEDSAAQAIDRSDQVAREIENTFYLALAQVRQMAFQQGREHNIPTLLRVRTYMPVAFSYLEEYRQWIQVQLLSAQHRPQEALSILDELLGIAKRDDRGLSVIELQLWRALLLQSLKQPGAAIEALTQAVVLAAPEECVRIFLDTGSNTILAGLLAHMHTITPVFVARLLQAMENENSLSPIKSHISSIKTGIDQKVSLNILLGTLNEREVEILHLLGNGLSNQEISHELYIGVGTVKWYLTNLYAKLDVGNRTQAVKRARELGIVQ